MSASKGTRATPGPAAAAKVAPTLAAGLVQRLGGRFSTEMGIEVDAGSGEVERWFLASALFGSRIGAEIAQRTFAVLEKHGIHRIADVAGRDPTELVEALDAGGYARYDVKTAARLLALAQEVWTRYGDVAEIGRRYGDAASLEAALDALPGWGPVTVGLFLRELRGVWPGACLSPDRRASWAGHHVGLVKDVKEKRELERLRLVARLAFCDERDLEAALVRLALAHRRFPRCPGGRDCVVLRRTAPPSARTMRRIPLPGGRTITVRRVRADDGPGLVGLFSRLGEEDVYRRFFSGRPPPDPFVFKMAAIDERGGFGLVATVSAHPGSDRTGTEGSCLTEEIVGEAMCEPLADGDGELGITVAPRARGWLGPYLLDVLLAEAADRGIPNLQADVLTTNTQMLAMLRRRGYAVLDMEGQPTALRVSIGSVGRLPSWPPAPDRRRVVIEVPGGRWYAHDALRKAGLQVMGCSGPPGGWPACPPLHGQPCPIAADADLVVQALDAGQPPALLDAHRRTHSSVPVCIVAPATRSEASPAASEWPVAGRIPGGAPVAVVVGIVKQLVAASGR